MADWFPWLLTVERPAWLAMGLLIPLLWWWSWQGWGRVPAGRWWCMILLRSTVLLLLILALAHPQWARSSDRVTVLFLLDQSASIPSASREAMIPFVVRQVAEHRQVTRSDRAGVIAFAQEAQIEVPPIDDDLPLIDRLEGTDPLPTNATDLSAALRLALATFPEDTARRVVIVSDGNETTGNALETAVHLATAGVGIDVVPVQLPGTDDVAVERLILPTDIRHGQPFDARLVLQRTVAVADSVEPAAGVLRLIRRRGGMEQTIAEERLALPPGKTVWRFRDRLQRPDFYEYEAVFVPDNSARDSVADNNRASGFTQLLGKGRVLMIEDVENRGANGLGAFTALANLIERLDFEVSVRFTDDLFSSLAELQSYDAVLLADAGRSSLGRDDLQQLRPSNFSDAQIEMLVQNTRQLGCGLIMLGGPNSLGAGGWANTKLESILPVDCQVRGDQAETVGALVMVMHASEMEDGNRWQKLIAREALRVLGPQDFCGIVTWNQQQGSEEWLWGSDRGGLLPVQDHLPSMLTLLGRMTPGDMPDFEPSLRLAADSLLQLPAGTLKHMIVISDGDPTRPRPGGALTSLQRQGVQVSTVAVGTHGPASQTPLREIADATGGQYYAVDSARDLPRIFQREARRVARPLIVERRLQPRIQFPHEILQGISEVPPLDGFVMSTVKQNPLVEVPIVAPYPADQRHASLLALWTVGLGRVAVWSSDAGQRWTRDWLEWPEYERFFGQLIRWCLRPISEDGSGAAVTAEVAGDQIRVIVDILEEDAWDQYTNLTARLIGPDMRVTELPLRRVAPRRYIGKTPAIVPGSYFVKVHFPGGNSPARVGVNVPYSSEFRQRESNVTLLQSLAGVQPPGGSPGILHTPIQQPNPAASLAANPFRSDLPPAWHHQRIWPGCLLAAAIILVGDILYRKIALQAVIRPWLARMWRHATREPTSAETPDHLQRLRQRKSAATAPWSGTPRGWQPADPADVPPSVSDADALRTPDSPRGSESTVDLHDTYIDRLLRAKRDSRLREDESTSD